MMYYVDTGAESLTPCYEYGEARDVALIAMQSAREFLARNGWLPFWAHTVEIRRGNVPYTSYGAGETRNKLVVAKTKPLLEWDNERATILTDMRVTQ